MPFIKRSKATSPTRSKSKMNYRYPLTSYCQRLYPKRSADLKKNEAAREQKREEKYQLITQIQELRAKGIKYKVIANRLGITTAMVDRYKSGNPACLSQRSHCKTNSYLDPYKNEIIGMLKQGLTAKRIGDELSHRGIKVNPRTMRDYCSKLKTANTDLSDKPVRMSHSSSAKIKPYIDFIKESIMAGKTISELYNIMKGKGYSGSYSLLCSYTTRYRYGNEPSPQTHIINRYDLAKHMWSAGPISEHDLIYIQNNWPKFNDLKEAVQIFRHVFTEKNISGLLSWIESHTQCEFDPINQFARGLKNDWVSVENALQYEYSNGMLEGFVNKLKVVKRTMYGRADYPLIRAKMLLSHQ